MNITFHPSFRKSYKKRIANNSKLVKQTSKRISLFSKNPKHPILRDHKLTGERSQYKSFWVNGDVRIVYEELSDNECVFYDIGTHNQLY